MIRLLILLRFVIGFIATIIITGADVVAVLAVHEQLLVVILGVAYLKANGMGRMQKTEIHTKPLRDETFLGTARQRLKAMNHDSNGYSLFFSLKLYFCSVESPFDATATNTNSPQWSRNYCWKSFAFGGGHYPPLFASFEWGF